jgi:hypothetical protein
LRVVGEDVEVVGEEGGGEGLAGERRGVGRRRRRERALGREMRLVRRRSVGAGLVVKKPLEV